MCRSSSRSQTLVIDRVLLVLTLVLAVCTRSPGASSVSTWHRVHGYPGNLKPWPLTSHAMECCDGLCRPSESGAAAIMSCEGSGKRLHVTSVVESHCNDYSSIHAASFSSLRGVPVTSRGLLSTDAARCLSHPSSRVFAPSAYHHASGHAYSSASALDPPASSPSSTTSLEEAKELAVSDAISPVNAHDASQDAPHQSSMAQLRVFLDLDALHDDSRRYTVRHIRHRYLLWKRENVLHHLEPRYMSSVIRLLGSLSISTPGKPFNSLHAHPRLPDMPESNYTPQWGMIIMLCNDKQRLRYPLWTSDRYWLMRARIAKYREHAATGKVLYSRWPCYQLIFYR